MENEKRECVCACTPGMSVCCLCNGLHSMVVRWTVCCMFIFGGILFLTSPRGGVVLNSQGRFCVSTKLYISF